MQVAIVILNWNRKEDTLECLRSVQGLRIENYELSVIVVDNASSDDSVEAVKRFIKNKNLPSAEPCSFVLLENEKNLGFAAGNNVGIKHALAQGADFVLILNNDTIVDKNLIEDFLSGAEEYKEAGVFSPKIYFAPGFEYHLEDYKTDERGHVIWYAGGIIDWNNVLGSNRGVDEVDKKQYDKAVTTDFATGAAMFVRREVLEKIGGFDERYFMYLEDADFCVRARGAGWRVMYLPKPQLWHKVGRSAGIGSSLNDYFISRNRLLFGMQYASTRAKLALFRESLKLLLMGRHWQRAGIADFYKRRFGKGRASV